MLFFISAGFLTIDILRLVQVVMFYYSNIIMAQFLVFKTIFIFLFNFLLLSFICFPFIDLSLNFVCLLAPLELNLLIWEAPSWHSVLSFQALSCFFLRLSVDISLMTDITICNGSSAVSKYSISNGAFLCEPVTSLNIWWSITFKSCRSWYMNTVQISEFNQQPFKSHTCLSSMATSVSYFCLEE